MRGREPVFGGMSYALLNAPGRFSTEVIDTNNNDQETLVRSPTSNFKQMRVLGGLWRPEPSRGWRGGERGAGSEPGNGCSMRRIQTSYNWNCCGLSVEYRKYRAGGGAQ